MRAKKCGMSAAEKNFRRLNYCGTCKTIGSIYGQKSRLLLNYDTVFLAEVLTALSGEDPGEWQNAYQSYNCLNLPQNEMPISLQFAAAANIILTKYKLADHISDEKKSRYHLANKAFIKEFKLAEDSFRQWRFPLGKVEKILQKQEKVESEKSGLEDFAAPTAETTAIFFGEGVKIIGKDELKDTAYKFGFAFGKLVYLLDAFEDYTKDFQTGKFNAFQKAFDLDEKILSNVTKRRIKAILNELETEIIEQIYILPFKENQKKIFASRLNENLRRKLGTSLPVLKARNVCSPKAKPTFSERWKTALHTARVFAKNYSWQMPAVFLFILVFALAAPAQSKEAKSAKECFDLSFNLMFLGGVFGSVLALPKPIYSKDPGRIYPDIPKTPNPGNVGLEEDKRRWCDWCDCGSGCCDGCECCCECDGCCDSCDCCSCD